MSALSVAPVWLWIAFSVGVLVLLAADMLLFGGHSQTNSKVDAPTSKKSALIESGLWITIALLFNAWFASMYGRKLGFEFLTGYLVEKSLSVDNLFIMLLIFNSFKIPLKNQHKVLFYGILGALVLRGVFILLGAQLLHTFHSILYVFGAILIFTAIKFIREGDDDANPETNWSVKILRKFVPVSDELDGANFFTMQNGVRKATPLLVALVAIEAIDLVFAVDSIPAVFAVTEDAFVAFASNILAVLGLRALYFVIADWVQNLRYLKPGLAAVLGFIGLKMLLADWFPIPSWISLAVIVGILAIAALFSYFANRSEANSPQPKSKETK